MITQSKANEKEEKEFEIISDKNNHYKISIIFETGLYITLYASESNNFLKKSFSNKYSLEQLKEIKYFTLFDDLKEIYYELLERMKNNESSLKEKNNKLILAVSLPIS